MKCDKCGGATHVTDVRHDEDNTYRKCVCKQCGHITYTVEYPIEKDKQFERTWSRLYRNKKE